MVSGTKFYIYGGGRWRELDINDGRVDGWGRARFVYPKRGKIRVAKSGAVLAGLRDLVAGKHGTVKDGSHLPHKKLHSAIKNKSKISVALPCIPKTDVCIQTSLPSQTLKFPQNLNEPRTRERAESTFKDQIPSKITTTAIVHKKQNINISSEENDAVTKKKRIPSLKLNKADSAKYNIYQRKRSNSSDSVVWVVLPKKKGNNNENSNEYLNSKQSKKNYSPKIQGRSKENYNKQRKVAEGIPNKDIQGIVSKTQMDTPVSNVKKGQDQCNELYIDAEDVEIFRRYLIKNEKNFDLIKFDEDDEYKKKFFFKINPLVNLERCQKIDQMLRRDSQNRLSLKDFVNQLGLKSVSEPSETKRYKMRKKKQIETLNYDTNESDEENLEPRKTKKIKSQTNKYKTTSDYDTSAESSEEHDKRLNRKFENLNALSDENSKKYVTRRSRGKFGKKSGNNKTKDLFSNDSNIELSTDEESRKPVTRSNRRPKENVILDLSMTTEEESDIVALRRPNRTKSTINVIESSDVELNERKTCEKRFYNNKKDESQNSSDDNNSLVNVRTKNKTSKRNQIDANSDLEISNRTNQRKHSNILDDNNSRDTNRKPKNSTKSNSNKIKNSEKEFNSENSEEDVTIENKRKYKKINKSISDTDEDNFETNKANKTDRNKENNFTKRNKINSNASSLEKPTKVTQRKIDKSNGIEASVDSNDEINSNKPKQIINRSNKIQNVNNCIQDKAKSTEIDKIKTNINSEVAAIVNNTKGHTISKRPSSSLLQSREYSNLEDHAIVSFVRTGGRARCVNGNRLWIELQDQYHAITGQTRSWHSLRNRYLRYILPKLGTLALPPTEEKRLRAAAATGEIKHKRSERRNSIFGAPTRGALSRRPLTSRSTSEEHPLPPKRHKHDRSRKATPPPSTKRVLRSSASPTPPATSPRYSEITRQFAAKHRQNESTPNSSPKPETKQTKTSSTHTQQHSKKEQRSNKRRKVTSDKVTVLDSESEFSEREQRSNKKKKEAAIKILTVLDSEIEFSESEQRSNEKSKEFGRRKKDKERVNDRSVTYDNSEGEFSKKEQRRSTRGNKSSAVESGDEISKTEQRSVKKNREVASKELTALMKDREFLKKEQRRSRRGNESSAVESDDEFSKKEQRSIKKNREVASKELTALMKDREFLKKEQIRNRKYKGVEGEKSIALNDIKNEFSKKRRSRRGYESSAVESDDEISKKERNDKKRREIVSKELTALVRDREFSKKEQRRNRDKELARAESAIESDRELKNERRSKREYSQSIKETSSQESSPTRERRSMRNNHENKSQKKEKERSRTRKLFNPNAL